MKPLLKVMLIVGSLFAMTFVLGGAFGLLTVENVRYWLEQAQSVDPVSYTHLTLPTIYTV